MEELAGRGPEGRGEPAGPPVGTHDDQRGSVALLQEGCGGQPADRLLAHLDAGIGAQLVGDDPGRALAGRRRRCSPPGTARARAHPRAAGSSRPSRRATAAGGPGPSRPPSAARHGCCRTRRRRRGPRRGDRCRRARRPPWCRPGRRPHSLTEPSRRRANPPRPRAPTTTMAASPAARSSASRGASPTTRLSIVSDGWRSAIAVDRPVQLHLGAPLGASWIAELVDPARSTGDRIRPALQHGEPEPTCLRLDRRPFEPTHRGGRSVMADQQVSHRRDLLGLVGHPHRAPRCARPAGPMVPR